MKLLLYIACMFIFIVLCSFLAEYSEQYWKLTVKFAEWMFGMIAGIGIGIGSTIYHFKK